MAERKEKAATTTGWRRGLSTQTRNPRGPAAAATTTTTLNMCSPPENHPDNQPIRVNRARGQASPEQLKKRSELIRGPNHFPAPPACTHPFIGDGGITACLGRRAGWQFLSAVCVCVCLIGLPGLNQQPSLSGCCVCNLGSFGAMVVGWFGNFLKG